MVHVSDSEQLLVRVKRLLRASKDEQVSILGQATALVVYSTELNPSESQDRPLEGTHIQDVSFPDKLCFHVLVFGVAEATTSHQNDKVAVSHEVHTVLEASLRLWPSRLHLRPHVGLSTE